MSESVLLVCVESKYVTSEVKERVARYCGERSVLYTTDREEILANKSGMDIVLGDLPRDLLTQLPDLKWFQQFGTGVEWLQENPGSVEAPYILTNCSDDHYMVVTDHLFALILGVSRGISRFAIAQARGRWERPDSIGDPRYFELRGKTILVVGMGSIGKETAKRAAAFGMKVSGVRRSSNQPVEGFGKVYCSDDLNTAAGEADLIAACLPDTSDTENVFDQSFFEAMKASGYFFNVGRGTCVDEDALDKALRSGEIAGAGLDVFAKEPLISESPLWTAPNLLITPHVAGYYDKVIETWMEIMLQNLQSHSEGKPLRNLVDKSAGY